MSYANGRLIHDADSHLMELDDCLDPYFDPRLLAQFHACAGYRGALNRNLRPGRSREAHADPAFRAGIDANWDVIRRLPDAMLVDSLSMLCPFAPVEKQALLEAQDEAARAVTLLALLRMGAAETDPNDTKRSLS